MTDRRFALVIFDCDGVLVDSELITSRVFANMLNELGITVSVAQVFEQFVGKSVTQCLEIIAGWLGREAPQDFVPEYHRRITQALRTPYCVASNGSHEKMQVTLGKTGLLSKFKNKLFSVSEVARGKPYPDIFLYAADKSGVPPAACAVIEDTSTGVTAGVAAGMTVFGYCAHTPAHRLVDAGAHFTFDRMSELPGLLRGSRHPLPR
jgi:HAD superfamily hydrolase (TIGR01509 family)